MDGEFLRAMKNIDKNLARIADALEKKNAPGGQDQGQSVEEAARAFEERLDSFFSKRKLIDPMEGFNQSLEKAFQEEASRFQMKDTGLFQSGEHDADSGL